MKKQKFHYQRQRTDLAWLAVVAPYVVFGVACATGTPWLGVLAFARHQRSAVETLNQLELAPAERRCRRHLGNHPAARPAHRSADRPVRCEG